MQSTIPHFLRSPIQIIRERKTIIKFLIVGASGTVVNEGLLYGLHAFVGLILAQAFGVEVSIINNFIWNDSFTFKHVTKNLTKKHSNKFYRLAKYNFLSLSTFVLNLTVYTSLLLALGSKWYIVSSLIGILTAFAFNYFGSSRWAWKEQTIDEIVRRKKD